MKFIYITLLLVFTFSCSNEKKGNTLNGVDKNETRHISSTSLVVLGTIQDAGSPQIACNKSCCIHLFDTPDNTRKIVSLGLIDVPNSKSYLFDATPDIGSQVKKLSKLVEGNKNEMVNGIFLTHAHIGHYTGIMFLGKEAMDAKKVPVYAMPKMKTFLENNGPWSQLVIRNNIDIRPLENEKVQHLSNKIKVIPFLVPHRDEYSETVGYKIIGPNKSALFIPDIDKWSKWDKDIVSEIKKVDYAFLDATFYSGKELNNRDMSQIPHPFILESLDTFKSLDKKDRNKVVFIHFNHTNPVINKDGIEAKNVIAEGFRIAQVHDVFEL